MMKKEDRKEQDWSSVTSSPPEVKTVPLINQHNKDVYLVAVWMLGTIGLISLLGIIGLAAYSIEIPQALVAICSGAIGALGTLFTFSK